MKNTGLPSVENFFHLSCLGHITYQSKLQPKTLEALLGLGYSDFNVSSEAVELQTNTFNY